MSARSIIGTTVLSCLVGLTAPAAEGQSIRCVDDDASTNGDGLTWPTAYKYLRSALFEAADNAGITEIHVAGGVYKPDQDEAGNVTPGDRTATFSLLNDLVVRGGYRGLAGGGDPDDRDIDLFESILSGDLAGDDEPDFANNDENSYHVVTGMSGAHETTILDGFTVTGGNANGSGDDRYGGGMFNERLTVPGPTIINCTFRSNSAVEGGGMYNYVNAPTVTNCRFIENGAGIRGGGVYNRWKDSTFTNCAFTY